MHLQSSNGTRRLIFCWTLRLLPYLMCANRDGSGETAQMRRLSWVFAGRLCDKYHNLMSWLISCLNGHLNSLLNIFSYYKIHVHEPGHEKTWSYVICEQQRPRSACASAQSDQCLCCSLLRWCNVSSSVTKISSLMLASVAEQASLSLTWSETPEDTFSHDEAHMYWYSLFNSWCSAHGFLLVLFFRIKDLE